MNIRVLIIFLSMLLLLFVLMGRAIGKARDYRNKQEGEKVLTEEVTYSLEAKEGGNRGLSDSGLTRPVS